MKASDQLVARIDYVKFLVSLEFDRAQVVFRTLNGFLSLPECHLRERENYKMTVLGADPDDGGKRRYVVEAWGQYSIELAMVVPADWFEHLVRIDWREPLIHTNHEAVAAFAQRSVMGAKSRRNVTAFNTKPRQKTNTRDVGGHGVIFGSRKSDQHTDIYIRGDEIPAAETRHQGRAAQRIGLAVCQAMDEKGLGAWHEALHSHVKAAHASELYKATGATSTGDLERIMASARTQMAAVQKSMDFIETEAEKTYWESLTPEEQEAEQRLANVPAEMLRTRPPASARPYVQTEEAKALEAYADSEKAYFEDPRNRE